MAKQCLANSDGGVMRLFTSELKINGKLTPDLFREMIVDWAQSNTVHPENNITTIDWNGEHEARFGDDHLWLELNEYPVKGIVAARYEKVESAETERNRNLGRRGKSL